MDKKLMVLDRHHMVADDYDDRHMADAADDYEENVLAIIRQPVPTVLFAGMLNALWFIVYGGSFGDGSLAARLIPAGIGLFILVFGAVVFAFPLDRLGRVAELGRAARTSDYLQWAAVKRGRRVFFSRCWRSGRLWALTGLWFGAMYFGPVWGLLFVAALAVAMFCMLF